MTRSRATRLGRAGLLLPMLLATACASVPDLGAKPTPAAASDYASSQSLSGAQSDWPAAGWWRSYGDPQLDGLITQGLSGSPSLAAALARFRTAQGLAQRPAQGFSRASMRFRPSTINSESQKIAGDNGHVPGGWHSTGTAALSLDFDLDLFGKNRAALRAAKRDTDAARFEMDEARLLLTTGVASTYADLAALYAQRDSLEKALDIRTQSLKVVQAPIRCGARDDRFGSAG